MKRRRQNCATVNRGDGWHAFRGVKWQGVARIAQSKIQIGRCAMSCTSALGGFTCDLISAFLH